mmetsp:Transcript_11226/g.28389  ORF Transcript_11226/g.28389 Transcript_11226/m.28389 type:complete len:94 (+) Transcript_11226:27-308(+)
MRARLAIFIFFKHPHHKETRFTNGDRAGPSIHGAVASHQGEKGIGDEGSAADITYLDFDLASSASSAAVGSPTLKTSAGISGCFAWKSSNFFW